MSVISSPLTCMKSRAWRLIKSYAPAIILFIRGRCIGMVIIASGRLESHVGRRRKTWAKRHIAQSLSIRRVSSRNGAVASTTDGGIIGFKITCRRNSATPPFGISWADMSVTAGRWKARLAKRYLFVVAVAMRINSEWRLNIVISRQQ